MRSLFATSSDRILSALDASTAIIEFEIDGTVIRANQNFCGLMGYTPEEIVGQKHRMFLDPVYAASPDYEAFWNSLRDGQFVSDDLRLR